MGGWKGDIDRAWVFAAGLLSGLSKREALKNVGRNAGPGVETGDGRS